MRQLILTGMIISSMPIGEYDKRLVLLTAERGKITAFSRGSRRQNSTMLGATEVGVFGRFTLIEGRNAYTLAGVDIEKYYMELRSDMTFAYMGFYCMEFAGYYSGEYIESSQTLKLLAATFNALCKKKICAKLIRRIFELKMLTINGEYPQVFQCIHCATLENLQYFSMDRFGTVCPSCKKYGGTFIKLIPSALYAMQYVIASDIHKLYSFTVNDDVLEQLDTIVGRCVRQITNKSFKSEEMLDLIL